MTEHQPGVSYMTTTYKPTVRVTPSGAELQVQASQRGNIINVTRSREGGLYLLVADARPVSAAKTPDQPLPCHDRTRAAGAGCTCLGGQHKRRLSFELYGLWLEAPDKTVRGVVSSRRRAAALGANHA
jgi:hypothetical protein